MWSISWLFIVEAVVIVAGNAISIVIFTTTRRLRSRKYMMIINLAVADLLSGVVSVPLLVYFMEGPDLMTIRTIYKFADSFFGAASIFGLAALAIERAHATYFPFKHNTLSKATYIVGLAVVWLVALVHALVSHFLSSYFAHILKVVFVIGISLTVVTVAYLLIWIKVTRMSNLPMQAVQEGNRKLTTTLAIVTIISYITMMPLMITFMYVFICGYSCLDGKESLLNIFSLLHFGNSFVNFVIYSLRMREFQAELLRRMGCRRLRQDDDMSFPGNSQQRSSEKTKETIHLVDCTHHSDHGNHDDNEHHNQHLTQ